MNKHLKLRLNLIILLPPTQQSFLWQTVSACWAQRLYVSPSMREQKIIVSLCVTSVWISIRAQILLLLRAHAWRRGKFASKDFTFKLFLGFPLTLCEWTPSWLQVTKAPIPRAVKPSCLFCPWDDYNIKKTYSCSFGGFGHWMSLTIVIWLILPVVICLSQRLSHACLSISNYTAKLRMAHYISYSLFDSTLLLG